ILVTALNPLIGYDLAAKIAKKAFGENRALKEVALEMCNLSSEDLDAALDPAKMTKGGLTES
ncbi:MAG: aspartate ammonia-lyase, partial [SAR324 cluster bacterium]|nr:aspartate ammonia-lyase [SAR324 cluster bacterium]